MPQQREDVFGTRYNGYTQKFHSRQEMFAAGVRDSDSEWEAAGKIQAKQRNDESLKRQQEANQMLFEKYGSSGLNLSEETKGEKGGLYYTLQFVFLSVPFVNILLYACLVYFIMTKKNQVEESKRKLLLYYTLAMVIPFAVFVFPVMVEMHQLYMPTKLFGILYFSIALNTMLFNYLCEQLREKK